MTLNLTSVKRKKVQMIKKRWWERIIIVKEQDINHIEENMKHFFSLSEMIDKRLEKQSRKNLKQPENLCCLLMFIES